MLPTVKHNPYSQLSLPLYNRTYMPEVIVATNECKNPILELSKKIASLRYRCAVQEIERPLGESIFIRDSMVLRLDGSVAIPCLLTENKRIMIIISYDSTRLWSLLPPSCFHFIDSVNLPCLGGFGGSPELYPLAEAAVDEFKLHSSIQKTFIEGGNVYLFQKDNKDYAVVGELSLAWSLLLLQRKGELVNTLANSNTAPSTYAYYLARNDRIKNEFFEYLQEPAQYFTYGEFLKEPLNEEELQELYQEAQLWEERITQTKQFMARDLQVPLENLVLIPQVSFHIDMDLVVTPSKKILVHKEKKAISLLNNLMANDSATPGEKDFFSHLLLNANKNIKNDSIVKSIKAVLNQHGLTAESLPLKFSTSQGGVSLNYANGIFLKAQKYKRKANGKRSRIRYDYTFLTTGPTYAFEKKIHEMAIKVLQKNLRNEAKVVPIPNVSDYIYKYLGGIRCMTFETS